MKKIMTIVASLAIVAGLASCQKERVIDNTDNGKSGKTVSITATFAGQTKVYYEASGDNLQPYWEKDDIIVGIDDKSTPFELKVESINGNVANLVASGNHQIPEGDVTLFYKKGLTEEDWDIENSQYVVNLNSQKGDKTMPAIMMAEGTITNDGGEFYFNNKGAVLGIYGVGEDLNGKTIKQVTLYGKGIASYATLKSDGVAFKDPNNGYNVISTEILSNITVKDDGTFENPILMAVPAGAAVEKVFIRTTTGEVYSLASSNKNAMAANNYRFIKDKEFTREAKYDDMILTGVFSVEDAIPHAEKKQVFFSKGNLQATYHSNTSTYSWGFADHQYDYIGTGGGNLSIKNQQDNAVVDLFGFSTERNNYGISTSNEGTDYHGVCKDWGTAIDDKGTWRTPDDSNSWLFIWGRKGDDANYKYKCGVTVCGKENCLVLAPDGWDISSTPLQDEYSTTSSPMTWEQAEAAGLVCLPAAGYRSGALYTYEVGVNGYYWLSNVYHENNAFQGCLTFTGEEASDNGPQLRTLGCSVRLISDCK